MAERKEELKHKIQQHLIEEVTSSYFFIGQELGAKRRALEAKIGELIESQEQSKKTPALTIIEKRTLIKEIVDEVIGYGPIDDLMKDEAVTEIMINGPERVYVEKEGKKQLTKVRFKHLGQLNNFIQRLVSFAGRKVDETTPFVDAALEDSARVNIIIPPLCLNGPTVTIRKFSKRIVKIDDLVRLGTLSKQAGEFLVAAVQGRINIIFSGATGVGKTTTLGVLSHYISADERVVAIEDTAELSFHQNHVVRLQARLPNIEGRGEITIRDLLRNSLRMRPERIVIGEIRSEEALDMLQAMASGHSGALSVIHAASPRDVISRLETMVAISGVNIPLWTIRRYIANNLNLIVQQERLQDGSRKITNITEVRGIHNDQIALEDVFTFDQEGFDQNRAILGRMKSTGVVPLFLPKLAKNGINLDLKIFAKEV
jgi:pilus assembly protein CpaF